MTRAQVRRGPPRSRLIRLSQHTPSVRYRTREDRDIRCPYKNSNRALHKAVEAHASREEAAFEWSEHSWKCPEPGGRRDAARGNAPTPKEAMELFGSVTEMATQVATHLAKKIKAARRRHSGRFAGRHRVLATNPHSRAKTYEKFGGRVPRLTTAGDLAAAKRLIAEMRAFRKAHRVALEAVKAGKRRVTFPAGTGKMHFIYGYAREVYVPLPAA